MLLLYSIFPLYADQEYNMQEQRPKPNPESLNEENGLAVSPKEKEPKEGNTGTRKHSSRSRRNGKPVQTIFLYLGCFHAIRAAKKKGRKIKAAPIRAAVIRAAL
jgi:hypothetical protein